MGIGFTPLTNWGPCQSSWVVVPTTASTIWLTTAHPCFGLGVVQTTARCSVPTSVPNHASTMLCRVLCHSVPRLGVSQCVSLSVCLIVCRICEVDESFPVSFPSGFPQACLICETFPTRLENGISGHTRDNCREATGLKVVDTLSRKLTKIQPEASKCRLRELLPLDGTLAPLSLHLSSSWRRGSTFPSPMGWNHPRWVAVQNLRECHFQNSTGTADWQAKEGTQRSFLYQILGYVG